MLSDEFRRMILMRVDLVLRNLRCANSAADVHAVGNMKNVAEGIKTMVEQNDLDEDAILSMLERVEDRQTEFFKKKFTHLK